MKAGYEWIAVLMPALLAACNAAQKPDDRKAQVLADIEARVAVARPGTRVCRDFRVGVSEQNWVKGTVTAIEGADIVVTVEEPGRILMDVQGVRLEKGTKLKDSPRAWTPCI